jgi:hypothetical protein
MSTVTRLSYSLYVDRTTQNWIVRDADGNFWVIPSTDNAWDQREPYEIADDAELVLVPGHYKSMLGLPF